MTPEDYGIVGIIMAYIVAFDAFKDMGLKVNLTNSFFKYPNRYQWIWKKIFGFVQVWSIIYGLALTGLLWLVIPDIAKSEFSIIALLIICPIVFFDPTLLIGRQFFQLSKKPIPISVISLLAGFVTIFVNYVGIVVYKQGYLGLLYGLFFSSLVSMLCYSYYVFIRFDLKPNFGFNWKWLKSKLKLSLPTVPHYYAGYIINVSDRVLLDFFNVPLKDIGMYSFAYSIGAYFSIIGKSYHQASGPFYMECYKKENLQGDQDAKEISYLVQFGMLFFAFIVSIWSKEIFGILANNDDLKSTYIIAIFIFFSYTYFPSYAFNGMKIWYKEKTKVLLKISVVAAVISIGLNLVLIPTVGYIGAAISTFLSMLYMGYGGFIFKDIKKLFYVEYNWKMWMGITIFLLWITIYIMDLEILFKFLISIIALLLILGKLMFWKKMI